MKSKAKTVKQYLETLPEDRREAIEKVRKIILKNLPKGYEENLRWGMLSYEVPLKVCPDTYNAEPLVYAALAAQKNYMAVYLMCVYSGKTKEKAFREGYKNSGKKLDMGKSCVRFKKVEDLPLDVIGEAIKGTPMKQFVQAYQETRKRSS